jgi:hypothetical protein
MNRMKNSNEAVVGIVVAILLLGFFVSVVSTIQVVYVPSWISQREAEHMDEVANQFAQLKYVLDIQSATEGSIPISAPVTLGSNELPFFSSVKAFGSLEILSNEYTVTNVNRTNTSSYSIGAIKYSSSNVRFVDQSYIYEAGAILLNQSQGNIMFANPSFSVSYNEITPKAWNSLANAPGTVMEGGSLAYDSSGILYAFRGGDNEDFWKYTVSNNTWSSLANTPDTVEQGSSLAYDDGNDILYALRGDNSNDFWKYTVSNNTWSSLAIAPAKVKLGGSLAYDSSGILYAFRGGDNDILYALRGDNSNDFWKYTKNANISFTIINISGVVGGKTSISGYGTYQIQTNFSSSSTGTIEDAQNITITTTYLNAWNLSLNKTLVDAGLSHGTDFWISNTDGGIKVEFSESITVNLSLQVIKIYARIDLGQVQ